MTLSMNIPHKLRNNTVFIHISVDMQQLVFLMTPVYLDCIISYKSYTHKNVATYLGIAKRRIPFQDVVCLCSYSIFFKTLVQLGKQYFKIVGFRTAKC
jgi:hypothetical protein